MATVTTVPVHPIINRVLELLKDVTNKEDDCQILQTDLRRMESLLQDIDIFLRYQQKEPSEIVKIWLQLLQNSLTQAKILLNQLGRRQSYLDSVVCNDNPRRLSKEIREWKAFFNHLSQRFVSDWFEHIGPSGNAINNHLVGPIIKLLEDVINKEDNCQILQTDLRRMERLLQDITTLFRDEPDITTLFQRQKRELLKMVKKWLQLLQNSLTEADGLLDRSAKRRTFAECVMREPRNLFKEISEWSASFDKIYDSIQSDLSNLVTSPEFFLSKPLYEKKEMFPQEAATSSEFEGSGFIDAQDQVEKWLNEGDHVHVIGVYGIPRSGKTHLLQFLCNKYRQVGNVFEHVIWITVSQNCEILELQDRVAHEIDLSLPSNFDQRKMKLSAYLKEKNFLLLLDDLWSRLDLQELGLGFGHHKHSKFLFSTRRKDLIPEMGAQQSTEIQPLSKDERWNLFRRVAFKDEQVSMDIEDRATKIANECKGLPVAVNTVAAAMAGKTSVDEWDNCLSSIKKVDPSFPATHPRLDAELYAVLRYGYDSLPNSDLKRCFLYCAMYKQDQEIDTLTLLQMWIGEGLVKSKQGSYLMDMAIGRKYLKLIVDRCLFQRVHHSTNIFRRTTIKVRQRTDVYTWNTIRVDDCIRDMAVYIGQKEENCLFMANEGQRNFPEVHDENCCRISLASSLLEDLPTELRCTKLASLNLYDNPNLKELPSGFLLSVTSLRVLNLSGCTKITSVPTSIGQLRMLEFLSLQELPIKDLPEEIYHISRLQFLHLPFCKSLESFPSKIAELQNLRSLYLGGCESLEMIPREISELTSLSSLVLGTFLSVEKEAPASIWSLKGLNNLTELRVRVKPSLGGTKSAFKDGIMGTWSEMRHLQLVYQPNSADEIVENLPQDMQNMKKLQSLGLLRYQGLSLPNCKFEHLEMVYLYRCNYITELSPLEWMPNLKLLKVYGCKSLRKLGIGSFPSGYLMLQRLVLKDLEMLESLAGPSNSGAWDETTLPELRVLKMRKCSSLKRFPNGIEKLLNLSAILGYPLTWWKSILWEDGNVKIKLENIFKEYLPTKTRNRSCVINSQYKANAENPSNIYVRDLSEREWAGKASANLMSRNCKSVPVFLILCYCIMLLSGHSEISEAAAVTDPKEVNALRIIASKMGVTKWNFNVDPCSCDSSWYTLDDRAGELGVICNCAFKKNTTCHVLKIKILYEEPSGIIPPELANLTYLSNIDLRYNLLHGSTTCLLLNGHNALALQRWVLFFVVLYGCVYGLKFRENMGSL